MEKLIFTEKKKNSLGLEAEQTEEGMKIKRSKTRIQGQRKCFTELDRGIL